MKLKLPLLGLVRSGRDAEPVEVVREVAAENKFFDLMGGMLDLGYKRLSDEKSISTKILQSNHGWVYRNNDVIAQEVAKIDFELYQIGLSGGEIVYNEVATHPLLDLLDKPNPETTKSDAIYIIQSHKKLTGDAFWLKIRNGGQVTGLRQLPPDKILLNLQAATPDDPTVILSYQYQDTINGDKVDITYQPEDIIHFKKPNPSNPFRGLGAVEAMKQVIDLDNLSNETQLNFFINGAIQSFGLTTDSKITDEQMRRLKAELRSTMQGTKNAFNVPVFGGGLTPVDLSYSNKDMQFTDQLEWYRNKIMVGFGNTPASLGIIEDVNRANSESTINHWLTNTVKPDMQAIVDTLNEFLVPEFGTNLVLGFLNPVPEDRTDDITEAKDLYQANIIMRSEARELLDYESDDSDMVYHDSSLATLTPDGVMPGDNDEAVDQEVEDAKEGEDEE